MEVARLKQENKLLKDKLASSEAKAKTYEQDFQTERLDRQREQSRRLEVEDVCTRMQMALDIGDPELSRHFRKQLIDSGKHTIPVAGAPMFQGAVQHADVIRQLEGKTELLKEQIRALERVIETLRYQLKDSEESKLQELGDVNDQMSALSTKNEQLIAENQRLQTQDETSFLVDFVSSTIRKMTPATDDHKLTALKEELVNILDANPFGSSGNQELKEKMMLWKDSVEQKRRDEDRDTSTLVMEAKKSRAKTFEISKLRDDLKTANQENESLKTELKRMDKLYAAKKEEMLLIESALEFKKVEISKLQSILHSKDDDTSQTEHSSDGKELQYSLRERDLRIAALESRLRTREAKLIAALNPEKKQSSNAAVQANYLSVAEFGLKGVEVCGEKVFEVTADSSEKYKWDSHGFQLTVPSGALPPGVTASVAVRSILAGPFELPEKCELIGAVYWISSTHAFKKKVTVHLQHCAIIGFEEECDHFKIAIGKCSQDLPYNFVLKNGVFTPHSQMASISVTQFSIFAPVVKWLTNRPAIQRQYKALIFHKQLDPTELKIAIVVIQDVRPLEEHVQQKFSQYTLFHEHLQIQFKGESESIIIQMFPREQGFWTTLPINTTSDTVILKKAVDDYQGGQHTNIPSCHFLVEGESVPVRKFRGRFELTQKNHLEVINFYVPVSPHPTQESSRSMLNQNQGTQCDQVDFIEKVATEIPASWYNFGLCLGIEAGELKAIERNYPTDQLRCFSEVYSIWKQENLQPLTWELVIKILRMKTMSQNALGSRLAKEFSL